MATPAHRPVSFERYDVAGEVRRAQWPDVVVRGRRLNRLTARVEAQDAGETSEEAAGRRATETHLLPSTLVPECPTITLDWPIHGPFVLSPRGTYFDTYLGVAQKLLDHHHPRYETMVTSLLDSDLLLRREIATDDYLVVGEAPGVVTQVDLARLWADAANERWPQPEGYRVFFSSSGAESVECALKLMFQVKYKRFLARHGMEVFRRVQAELGFSEDPYLARDPGLTDHPAYDNYPFSVVGCEGAFHGRTLGALSVTWSKRAHQLGQPKFRQVHHVPFNAPGDAVRDRIDWRGIEEILAVPGELARVMREQRRIPKDLFAGFLAEPFQGEGGYVPAEGAFFRKARAVCDEAEGLLATDEVQAVGRTGRLFMIEHLGVRPDVVTAAKSQVIGVTIAPAALAQHCHVGWHSNTWGGGRMFDVNFAFTTLHTLLCHKDPAFDGLSYLENEELKGEMFRARLAELANEHPQVLDGVRGYGLMNAILVRRRADVVRIGWRKGLKLLGCGWPAEVSAIRILGLADTLGREVDELCRVLGDVLAEVERL